MSEQTHTPEGTRLRISARRIAALVLIAIGVAFIVQNRQIVQITLFISTASGPLWAILLSMLVLGVLVGFLWRRKHR